MNNRRIFLIALCAAISSVTPLSAQDPGGDKPNPSDKARYEKWLEKGPMTSLTPEERKMFLAARLKALDDPKVKADGQEMRDAEKSFREAMGRAIIEQDPTLKPVLTVMKKSRADHAQDNGTAGQKEINTPPSSGPEAFGELTPDERRRLHDATEKAKDQPDVKAVVKKQLELEGVFHDVVNTAMIKADPSVAPVIEKMEKAMKENPQFNVGPRYQHDGPGNPPPPPPF